MNLGKNLRYLRKKKKLSQDFIGKIVGKDYTTIQKWETNNAEPNLAITTKLADYFNVNIDDFVIKDLENETSEIRDHMPYEKTKSPGLLRGFNYAYKVNMLFYIIIVVVT